LSEQYIVLIALSLALDTFAVSISVGLSCNNNHLINALKTGISFGIFHWSMTVIGWTLGSSLKIIIDPIDHWISFLLLSAIGIGLIIESNGKSNKSLSIDSIKMLITLSIATSVDALATGVTFSLFNVNIYTSALLIGLITYFLSLLGVWIGNKISYQQRLQSSVNIIGGVILIIIGIKILITHLSQHI
jgi:putative Mn2+ efflux pump MntP